MISNTTPKEKQIENTFMREFLTIAGKCLNLDPKPPLRVGRPIDDLFVAKIAIDWQRRRSSFLEEEHAASVKSIQEFARFLIARMNMADRICNCLYLLEMSKFDWYIRAGHMVTDLKRMARGKSLEVPLEPRNLLDKEQLRVLLGVQCPPYCVEVFWALWTRQEFHSTLPAELQAPGI